MDSAHNRQKHRARCEQYLQGGGQQRGWLIEGSNQVIYRVLLSVPVLDVPPTSSNIGDLNRIVRVPRV